MLCPRVFRACSCVLTCVRPPAVGLYMTRAGDDSKGPVCFGSTKYCTLTLWPGRSSSNLYGPGEKDTDKGNATVRSDS